MNSSLPRDPFMLLSYVNTQLRDHYPSLEALCDDMQLTSSDIVETLSAAGFEYNREQNIFW